VPVISIQVDKEVMILTSYETAMRTAHNFLAVFLAKWVLLDWSWVTV